MINWPNILYHIDQRVININLGLNNKEDLNFPGLKCPIQFNLDRK